MINNNLVCVGKILKSHGVKGELKLISYTSTPSDIFAFNKLKYSDEKEIKIKKVGTNKDIFIVSIEGITTRDMAEELSNTLLYVERESLKQAAENEYYFCDLKNCQVIDTDDNLYGTVTEIHNFGAGDILEVALEDNKKEYLPFADEFIIEVNIIKKYIVYNLAMVGLK